MRTAKYEMRITLSYIKTVHDIIIGLYHCSIFTCSHHLSSVMIDDDDLILCSIAVLFLHEEEERRVRGRKRQRKQRSCWVKPWVKRRKEFGHYHIYIGSGTGKMILEGCALLCVLDTVKCGSCVLDTVRYGSCGHRSGLCGLISGTIVRISIRIFLSMLKTTAGKCGKLSRALECYGRVAVAEERDTVSPRKPRKRFRIAVTLPYPLCDCSFTCRNI